MSIEDELAHTRLFLRSLEMSEELVRAVKDTANEDEALAAIRELLGADDSYVPSWFAGWVASLTSERQAKIAAQIEELETIVRDGPPPLGQ